MSYEGSREEDEVCAVVLTSGGFNIVKDIGAGLFENENLQETADKEM